MLILIFKEEPVQEVSMAEPRRTSYFCHLLPYVGPFTFLERLHLHKLTLHQ